MKSLAKANDVHAESQIPMRARPILSSPAVHNGMGSTAREIAGEVAPQGDGGGRSRQLGDRSIPPPPLSLRSFSTSPAISRTIGRPYWCNAGEERRTSITMKGDLTQTFFALNILKNWSCYNLYGHSNVTTWVPFPFAAARLRPGMTELLRRSR